MKRLWHAYGFTLCFLTAGLVWVYMDIRVPHKQHFQTVFLQDSLPARRNTTTVRSTPVSTNGTQFYNVINQKPDASVPQQSADSVARAAVATATQTSTTAAATNVPPPTAEGAPRPVHIVVIVSYMRSGSTFTADILQHYPGTVYVFEPFHMVMVRTRLNKPLYYLNGTKKFLKQEDLTDDFMMNELRKWFSCRYTELDVHSLADNFHTYFSRSMKKLIDCWRPKRHTLKSMRECLPAAMELCLNAKHRLFKFIRLPMRIMNRAMEIYQNLQVVHLIRDPRGSLTSQVKVLKANWSSVDQNSIQRCSAVADDLNYTLPLIKYYPQRVKILIYEDLARKPLAMARKLLTFLTYPPYKYVLRYISKLTSEGRRDGKSYGIIRGNSSKTAFSWRHKVDFSDVRIIDNNCQNIYGYLGFQPMTSLVDLVDDSVPTHISPGLQAMI